MKIRLLDVVVLTQDVPKYNLRQGESGTVVEVFANGEAFEVEFIDSSSGYTYALVTLYPNQLRVIHTYGVDE